MTDIKKYIEERRELRLQGNYYSRKPVYLQGNLSPQEALNAFKAIGDVQLIQACSKGTRRTIWDKRLEWGRLENNLLVIK